MPEVEIGKVSDFFAHPVVAGIELSKKLKVGDYIHIQGHTNSTHIRSSTSINAYHHAGDFPGIIDLIFKNKKYDYRAYNYTKNTQ